MSMQTDSCLQGLVGIRRRVWRGVAGLAVLEAPPASLQTGFFFLFAERTHTTTKPFDLPVLGKTTAVPRLFVTDLSDNQ